MITNSRLDEFILRFRSTTPRLKADKIKQAKQIISEYKVPERYLEGLVGDEKFLRQIELVSKRRKSPRERYENLESDVIARKKGIPKKGSCTEKWEKLYPNAKSNESKSKITGIPKDILDQVDHKGMGAYYSSGSRPGQTSQSWGKARVNCFILNKKTVTQGPDRLLFEQAIQRSPKARQWFDKTKF
jgi:hypothetical protein